MDNFIPHRPGGQAGTDRGAQFRNRPPGRGPLVGVARREFEKGLLGRPGLKGSRLAVLRTLLDDFAWGKAVCWPSNARIAAASGLSVRTVQRALHDLEALGIVRLVAGEPRRIVLVDHPHAADALGDPASDRHPLARRPVATPGDRLSPEALNRSNSEPETPPGPRAGEGERFLETSNDRTTATPEAGGEPEPAPPPAGLDWRSMAAELARRPEPEGSAAAGPVAAHRRRIGLDRATAPMNDPVIAGELAQRCTAQPPTATEVLDAVLGPIETHPDARGEACKAPEVSTVEASQERASEATEMLPSVDRLLEQETIRALSAVGPGATAKEVQVATLRLASLFGDHKSLRFYRGVVNDVARGELPARVPIAAVEWACGPGIARPAAAFTGHIERCREVAARRG